MPIPPRLRKEEREKEEGITQLKHRDKKTYLHCILRIPCDLRKCSAKASAGGKTKGRQNWSLRRRRKGERSSGESIRAGGAGRTSAQGEEAKSLPRLFYDQGDTQGQKGENDRKDSFFAKLLRCRAKIV